MNVIFFAFGAGVLATVNPCGFVMLPAFLTFYLGAEGEGEPPDSRRGLVGRIGHGFVVGLAVSVGFAGVFTAAGLLIWLGLRPLMQAMPWAAVLIGGLLTAAGVALIAGRQIKLSLGTKAGMSRGPRNFRGMVAFGAAYAVASLSCTLAVLLAVVAQASTTTNPAQSIAVFAAYAAGSTTILVIFAVAAALAQATLARTARRVLPVVTCLGGIVLACSGLYLIAYWLPVLAGAGPARWVTVLTDRPSAALTGFLDGHQMLMAVLAAGLLIAGVVIALVVRRRRAGREPAQPSPGGEGCCTPDQGSPSAEDTGHDGHAVAVINGEARPS